MPKLHNRIENAPKMIETKTSNAQKTYGAKRAKKNVHDFFPFGREYFLRNRYRCKT